MYTRESPKDLQSKIFFLMRKFIESARSATQVFRKYTRETHSNQEREKRTKMSIVGDMEKDGSKDPLT